MAGRTRRQLFPRYKTPIAMEIVKRVRLGETLSRICEDAHMPELTECYDWLKHPVCKIYYRTFSECYAEAVKDRAHTWQDQAVRLHAELPEDAEARDVRRVEAQANALMRLAKDQIPTLKIATAASKDRTINVTIKRFERAPPPVEEAPPPVVFDVVPDPEVEPSLLEEIAEVIAELPADEGESDDG